MNATTVGILISAVSLVCTAVNVWLKVQIKVEMHEMKDSLLGVIRAEYPTREIVDTRLSHIDERIARLERA